MYKFFTRFSVLPAFAVLLFLLTSENLSAQTFNDGCMRIRPYVRDTWVGEFEDPFAADELALYWYGADNANLDLLGWRNDYGFLYMTGSNHIGWRTIFDGGSDQIASHPLVDLFDQTYGTIATTNTVPTPQYLQIRGSYTGDDCGGASGCTTGILNCFGDDDDYCYDDVLTTTFNYRFSPPNQSTSTADVFTNNHGSSDFGARVAVNWSSPIPVGITASPSTSVCAGGSLLLTATGGTVFGGTYRWYTSGGTFVGTGTNITVSPVVNTTYRVFCTNGGVDGLCFKDINVFATATPVTSNVITPSNPVGPFCSNGNPGVINGTSQTVSLPTWDYEWQTSTNGGASWTTVSSGTSAVLPYQYNPPSTSQTLDVRFVINAGGCSNSSNVVTYVIQQPIANNNIGADQTWCGTSTPLGLTGSVPTNGSGSYIYQWQSSAAFGGPFTNILGANAQNYSPGPLATTTYFRREVSGGPCAASNSNIATITIQPLIGGNTISANQSFCGSGDPVTLTGTGTLTGGNGSYTYQWQESIDGGNTWSAVSGATGATYDPPVLTQTTIYRRTVFSGNCFDYNNAVTITIYPVITNNSISTDQSSCGSFTSATLIGTTPGGGTGSYTYQWEQSTNGGGTWITIGGAISANYSPGAVSVTTQYHRIVNSLPCSDVSNVVTVTIVPVLANNTIDNYQRFCNSGDPVLINGTTPTGGTGSYTYQWESSANGLTWSPILGATGATYDPPFTSATVYYHRIASSSVCSSTSNTSTVLILALPQVTQVTHTDVLCNGGSTGNILVAGTSTNGSASFSIDGGTVYQPSGSFGGLTAGNYNVFITDDSACVNSYAGNPEVVGEPAVLTHTTAAQNASCDNVFDGSITVTATGGILPYTYSLNNGPIQPGNIFGGLADGTYSILVTDDNGCTSSSSATIDTAYAVYGSLVSQTPVSCFGGIDGTVTVQLTGGLPPYSYSINGVQFVPASTFTGLASGNYVVTLRDSKGCTDFVTVTITQPLQLQAQIDSVFNIGCNGSNTGAIYITVSGGNPVYSFLWSNAAVTEDVTGLAAGTYNVAVTDSKGCTTSVGATISQPLPLFLNIASYHDLLCYNDSSGSVDVTANGGVPPYSFVWSNGETTEDIYGLLPNTYSVTVTDANGCQQTISQDVIQPAQLSSTISSTQVLCAGASSGSVDLGVTGGTSPYNYVWNNGAITEDLTGVPGGTYTVVIHDANGCSVVNSVTVTEPAPVTISVVKTDVLCNGGSTGAIDITVNGGTPTITYTWSNSAVTEDLTGITAGNYSVVITDGNGCTASASAVITQPAAIVMNASVVNVGCAGGADGSIDITVQGGIFPYTYLWSNSAVTEDIQNVSGGNFSVTVTDANLCTITASFTLTEPSAITSSIIGTDVTCNGANNGAADLTVSGGTAPYVFLWSTFQGSEDISGLDGGLYYVIITDANGCESKDSVLLAEPAPLILTTVVTNISCFNANDGAIDLTVTGGTPTYSYAWSNAAITEDLSSLPGGLYVVTVTDNHNCSATTSVTIVNPSAIYTNFIVKNPLCYGDTSGRIDLIVSGGTPLYDFSWSNSAVTEDLLNIPAGTYIVTVTDSRNCSRVDSTTVIEPGQIFTSGVVKNVTCAGLSDGFVDITAYAGTLPYSYTWSTLQSTEDIFNIPGGDYYVTVTDANGCQAVSLYIIKEPLPLGISIVKTDVQCFDAATGTLAVIPTGGSHPYYYLWNTFDTDSLIQGVVAGHYVVQLTDSNGCFIYDSIDITQPTEINIAASLTDAICFGAATAIVDVTTTGGTPSYTFGWSNSAVIEDLNGVVAGTYTLTVTDGNTCQKSAIFTVGQGTQIIPNLGTYDPICHGGNTGSITSITTGGVQPYVYSWSNSKTTISIGNLIAGTYTLTITDALTCTASASATLNDPSAIVVTANSQGAKCFNTASGIVNAGVTGGFGPYTYLLNGVGQSTDTFTNLLPGDYLLIVTDVNGCQGTANFSVSSPTEIYVDLGVTQQVILTGMNTQLVATATSQTPILNYFWQPDTVLDFIICGDPQNCANPYAAPLTTTTFTVTVMNADSCYASDTVTVQVLNQPSAFIPTAFTPNDDQLNDRFEFDILGAKNIDVVIFDRWGQQIYANATQANGMTNSNGWDGKVNGKPAPFDTYVYQLKVTYFDNVTKPFTGTVTIMK